MKKFFLILSAIFLFTMVSCAHGTFSIYLQPSNGYYNQQRPVVQQQVSRQIISTVYYRDGYGRYTGHGYYIIRYTYPNGSFGDGRVDF